MWPLNCQKTTKDERILKFFGFFARGAENSTVSLGFLWMMLQYFKHAPGG